MTYYALLSALGFLLGFLGMRTERARRWLCRLSGHSYTRVGGDEIWSTDDHVVVSCVTWTCLRCAKSVVRMGAADAETMSGVVASHLALEGITPPGRWE
jgi:hypothetical protein